MSDDSVYEVVVYGDAPEGGGGGTDTISVPIDFYTFWVLQDPVIVNIPDPGGGGAGGDVDGSKDWFALAAKLFVFGGVAFTVVAAAPASATIFILGASLTNWSIVGGVLAGMSAFAADEAATDPPQPNYARPAYAAVRTTTLTPEQITMMEPLLAADQQLRLFIDAIECAQGAFLAADLPWLQRHTLHAAAVYVDVGNALLAAADTIEQSWTDWTAQVPGAQTPKPAQVRKLLEEAAQRCGLDADETTAVIGKLESRLARATVPVDVPEAMRRLRSVAKQFAEPSLIDMRFEFPKPAAGG